MRKNTFLVLNSGGNLHLSNFTLKAIALIALLFTFSNSFAQTIPSTGGATIGAAKTAPGWDHLVDGTPDISDRD